MSIRDLFAVELPHLAHRYAARHAAYPALAEHPTLDGLIERLTDDEINATPAMRQARAPYIAALVEAHQREPGRLWEIVLLAALAPMVVSARSGLHGADADERESLFLWALSQVLLKIDPRDRPEDIQGIIWRKAKKRVVRKLRREREWEDARADVDTELLSDDTDPLAPTQDEEAEDRATTADTNAERATKPTVARREAAEALQRMNRGELRAYVERQYGDLPKPERDAMYERLRKRRYRRAAQVREGTEPRPVEPLAVVRRRRVVPAAGASQTRLSGGTGTREPRLSGGTAARGKEEAS